MLYDDLQAAVPVAFCPECGGEIYGPGGCLRCRVRREDSISAEREEHIKCIRDTVEKEHLTYAWLAIQILRTAGIKTTNGELSAVLSGSRRGPKADTMILAAADVCDKYWEVFL